MVDDNGLTIILVGNGGKVKRKIAVAQQEFPGIQFMLSRDTVEVVTRRHQEHLKHYGATNQDCWIEEIAEVASWMRGNGYQTEYTLRWNTYKGWRVYMLHTGCFAA